jgi:hypothetical protein
MKRSFVLIIVSLVVLTANAQVESPVNSETTRKLTREQRIEQRKAETEAMAKMVDWMVANRKFVLEAEYLSNNPANLTVVSSKMNFIIVDSSSITIQLASNTATGGLNGMGGMTTEGNISKYIINKAGKKYPYYNVQIMTMTHIASYDIFFNIYPDGHAKATIGGLSGVKLVYEGNLVPVNLSKVYKAMSL